VRGIENERNEERERGERERGDIKDKINEREGESERGGRGGHKSERQK